jgi:hypothetical protein
MKEEERLMPRAVLGAKNIKRRKMLSSILLR